jgi:endonuclease-3 related protein
MNQSSRNQAKTRSVAHVRSRPQHSEPRSRKLEQIRKIYTHLLRAWGPQHWWPGESPLEVIVGAFLTQNTSWTNVERAIRRLHSAGVLTLEGLRRIPTRKLEQLIRSSGYFRQKAARLKGFVAFLDERYDGSLARMFAVPTTELREQLLALKGVGPETADSILLYAGQHPVFVVDAYTRRIVDRHGILPENAPYEEIRALFEDSLRDMTFATSGEDAGRVMTRTRSPASHPPSPMSTAARAPQAQAYNEMHGLIVGIGKHYCRKTGPHCEQCPLRSYLPG